MASKIDIWNAAIAKLGQDVRVTSPSENTKHARTLNVAWQRVLDFVLADAVWTFALRHKALALSTEETLGWGYRYDYPSDCLKAVVVCDAGGVRQYRDAIVRGEAITPEFEVQGGAQGQTIVADIEAAYLIYVERVNDTGRFTPKFIEALACRLAADIAPVVAGEIGIRLSPELERRYVAMKETGTADAFNEGSEPILIPASPTLAARGGA